MNKWIGIALALTALEHAALLNDEHITLPPAHAPAPHAAPIARLPPLTGSLQANPSSVVPSQLSSSPLQLSALGVLAPWHNSAPPLHTRLPTHVPMSAPSAV